MHHFCQELISEFNPDLICRQTVDWLKTLVNQANIGLFLLEGNIVELKSAAISYQPYLKEGDSQGLNESVLGRVAATGLKYLVDDVLLEPDFVPISNPCPTRSQYCFPLIKANSVVGVLDIQSRETAACSPQTVEVLDRFTGFLAVAIANAFAVSALQRRMEYSFETEKNLRVSEQMFKEVVVSVSAHIYVTEVTSRGRLINHYLSPNVESLTGYAHQEFMNDWGFWPNQVIYGPDRPLASQQLQQLRSGQSSTVEYRLKRADNQLIWVRDSGRVEKRGHSLLIYGVVSDITDRKHAEQALIQERALLARRVSERTRELSLANAELARAARLKDEFLANISHELRTPLNSILGMAEILRTQIYGLLNENQIKAASHIDESGRHLLALITDILDLSKIEAQKLELEISPTYIDYVSEASLRMVDQIARKKRIKISAEYDSNVKYIQADPRRVKQILVNLLSNAVKFTPEGGQIGLCVQGDQENRRVHFTVWDTGVGIAPESIGRLFEPFVQLDSTLSRQHEGSGLGLSLVAKLAELHNGSVSVESTPNQGSRFTVTLPWTEAPARPPKHTDKLSASGLVLSPPSAPHNRAENLEPLVLLAEDNEANIITLTEFLNGMNYQVIAARNGTEALKRAIEDKPDLILMDIQMPGMDGLETTRKIRAIPELDGLPIIALTALAMPDDRERCLNAGVDEYLSKPVSLKKLLAVMELQLQKVNHKNGNGIGVHT